jgi:hypothetical protein
MSGDLTLRKRTMTPIKSLIHGLRRYDLDRCAALYSGNSDAKVVGFISAKSKIYLVRCVNKPLRIWHVLKELLG